MYPSRRALGMRAESAEDGLVRQLATSRVLQAYSVERSDGPACPGWVAPTVALLIVLVTVALGLHVWLHSLTPLSRDEAALATFLAVLFTLSWVSAVGLVCAIALLAVLWASTDGRTRARPAGSFARVAHVPAATRSDARTR